MSLFMGGKQIVGSGETPRIGTNGNWYIGANDTGVPSGATVHYTNAVQFKTQSEEGIYFVYEPPANMTIYHIDENGKKRIVGNKDVIVPVCGSNGNWFIGSTELCNVIQFSILNISNEMLHFDKDLTIIYRVFIS